MDPYLEQNGYVNDINKDRLHHEIYMSDARKVAPEKWKTVIRHPIKKSYTYSLPNWTQKLNTENQTVDWSQCAKRWRPFLSPFSKKEVKRNDKTENPWTAPSRKGTSWDKVCTGTAQAGASGKPKEVSGIGRTSRNFDKSKKITQPSGAATPAGQRRA